MAQTEQARRSVHVAAAILCDSRVRPTKIFAAARGYGPYRGRWEFPGGKLEPGETAAAACVRELREELAVEIEPFAHFAAIEYDYPDFHLTMDCFLAAVTAGQIELREAAEARWLGAAELYDVNWLDADVQLLPRLAALLGGTDRGAGACGNDSEK